MHVSFGQRSLSHPRKKEKWIADRGAMPKEVPAIKSSHRARGPDKSLHTIPQALAMHAFQLPWLGRVDPGRRRGRTRGARCEAHPLNPVGLVCGGEMTFISLTWRSGQEVREDLCLWLTDLRYDESGFTHCFPPHSERFYRFESVFFQFRQKIYWLLVYVYKRANSQKLQVILSTFNADNHHLILSC